MKYHYLLYIGIVGWMLVTPAFTQATTTELFPYTPEHSIRIDTEYHYTPPSKRVVNDRPPVVDKHRLILDAYTGTGNSGSNTFFLPEARDLFYHVTQPLAAGIGWMVEHADELSSRLLSPFSVGYDRSMAGNMISQTLSSIGTIFKASLSSSDLITFVLHLGALVGVVQPSSRKQYDSSEEGMQDSIDELSDDQTGDVTLPPFDPLNPGLIDPYDVSLDSKIQKVLLQSADWNPLLTDAWLQCTTYVTMIYELNGFNLTGKLVGNANQWLNLTDHFYLFQSGHTPVVPQVFDTVLWTDTTAGHVGIVIEVTNGIVTVANANVPRATYQFRLIYQASGFVSLVPLPGQGISMDWTPQYWLRPKTRYDSQAEDDDQKASDE